MAPRSARSPFGRELRHWRRLRGFSQLELAVAADSTARHVSFLETGRSRPTAPMVVRLSDALRVPLRERNRLLEAAGLPPLYSERPLEADDMAPFRAALDRMLAQHEPYPAFVVDRHWSVVLRNRTAHAFAGDHDGTMMDLYHSVWRDRIVNWDVIAWHVVAVLRDEVARHPDDERLAAMLDTAREAVVGLPPAELSGNERVLCPSFRVGDQIIHTLTVVAHFGSARDITLDELRLELMFPRDQVAERFFRDLAAGAGAHRPGDQTSPPAPAVS